MGRQTHLQRRNGLFRFRIRAPKHLAAISARREIVCALGTRDPAEARIVAARLTLLSRELFEQVKDPMLTEENKKALLRRFYDEHLARDAAWRVQANRSNEDRELLDLSFALGPLQLKELRRASARGDLSPAAAAAANLMRQNAIELTPGSPAHDDLVFSVLRGMIEVAQRSVERDTGDWTGRPRDPLLTPEPHSFTVQPALPRVDVAASPATSRLGVLELHERYLAERKDGLRDATKRENRQYVRWLDEFLERKPVGSITKSDVVRWKDALVVSFPAQAAKIFPNKTFPEVLELNKRRQAPVVENKTVQKYLSAVRAFFAWCERNGHVDVDPAKGVSVSLQRAVKKRSSFKVDALNTLFGSPLFVGCRGPGHKASAQPGKLQIRDHRYWAPLLALFTGARESELLQLRLDDIKTSGTDVELHFVDREDARLKTENAQRAVPLHSRLRDLGFIDFVEARRRGGFTRLFDDVDKRAYSKAFSRNLQHVGLKDAGLCFHSFRHTFTTALRDAGVGDSVIKALLGHSTSDVTAGYGHVGREARQKAIAALTYPGLMLGQLTARPRSIAA